MLLNPACLAVLGSLSRKKPVNLLLIFLHILNDLPIIIPELLTPFIHSNFLSELCQCPSHDFVFLDCHVAMLLEIVYLFLLLYALLVSLR